MNRSEISNINYGSQWQHFCFTWAHSTGTVKYYTNGQEGKSKTALTDSDSTIPGGGKFYVGQLQGSYGGGFDDGKSFRGYMSNLNMWNRLLNSDEIKSQYNNGACNDVHIPSGDEIVKWSILTTSMSGDVKSATCPTRK